MKRIAIIGGGISGLTAAFELEKARKAGADIDWQLYEASNRLGGIIETTRIDTPEGRYVLEGGPDGWVTEKPWARELAIELGLEADLIYSNDATRKTYILVDGKLQPIPDRMRMMVPEDLSTLEGSPLFSAEARAAYANELARADDLRELAPAADESIASFVSRHFGNEVLEKIGAPLLSGVFGGDVEKLSVRAVMPTFVAMEREHGSLIAALQAAAAKRGNKAPQPIFTSLRNGVASLIDSLIAALPAEKVLLNRSALSLKREGNAWCLRTSKGISGKSKKHFQHVLLATPIDVTRALLQPLDDLAVGFLPSDASSAVLATLCWPETRKTTVTLPPGFGFLSPQSHADADDEPQLLAATFVDQKFPHRAPPGAHSVRVFFGGPSAQSLANRPDEEIASAALTQLQRVLGPLPAPHAPLTSVRRWPRSLPQYEVGHLEQMAQLDQRIETLEKLTLLGNGYRGVGLPDLIRDARNAARAIT